MADTTFVTGTVVQADWLNDVNDITYGLGQTTAGKGAELVAVDDGAGGSLFTTVKGFIDKILSSTGGAIIGFTQTGLGAQVTNVQTKLRSFVTRTDFDTDGNFDTARNALSSRTDLKVRPTLGTADRSLFDKVGEVVSFKDFGAVGDGATDDTVAVQAALRSGARTIRGNGQDVYLLSGTVYVDNAYATELQLNGATFKMSTGVNMMRLQNAAHKISNGIFDGNSINAQFLGIIVHDTAAGSIISSNKFLNIGACAIQVQDSAHYVRIEKNEIINCGRAAATVAPFYCSIYVNITEGVQVTNNKLTQCSWGVYLRGSASATPVKDFVVSENYITGANIAASQGISNQYPYNGVISGNIVKDFGDNAIDCYGGVYVTISGNKSEACKDGVFVGHQNTREMVVTDNTSVGDDRGVRILDTASDIVVSNNVCRNPTVDGIEVGSIATGLCSRVVVSNNRIDCNSSGTDGIVLDNTEMCAVIGNSTRQTDQVGIKLSNCNLTTVLGNSIQDASSTAANTYDAILNNTTSNRAFIDNNVIYGSCRYGINLAGGTNSAVRNNRGRALGTGIVQNLGTTSTITDNLAV